MKLDIIQIADRGVASKERLHLRVLEDADLVYYIIFDTVYSSASTISNSQKDAFWFKPKKVKSGDHVIIYSGTGTNTESKNADGTTNHFYFWGKQKTMWNEVGDCAVLFEINTWKTSLPQ